MFQEHHFHHSSNYDGTNAVFVFSAHDEPGMGDVEGANEGLEDVVRDEHEYLHERLREDLGREPTEDELNEWLRQHTEGH